LLISKTEFEDFSDELAGAVEDELEKHEKELNEAAGIVGIIGYILVI
jgi:hypothetical protein